MNCSKCSIDPTFHSFEFIYRKPSGEAIFYTSPAKGKQREMKDEHIPDYVAHMDSASSSSWIWVFDCSGLQSYQLPSVSTLKKFVNIIQERYRFVLKSIVLINMNWKMEMILTMTRPFVKEEAKQKLLVIHSLLELVEKGFDGKIIQYIKK
jgi:hypothetical protein